LAMFVFLVGEPQYLWTAGRMRFFNWLNRLRYRQSSVVFRLLLYYLLSNPPRPSRAGAGHWGVVDEAENTGSESGLEPFH
jgi:hypothetical protein